MSANIKVFLIDDQEISRSGLRKLVDSETDMQVIGEAGDGETALEALSSIPPDVIVINIRMPGVNGIETEAILKRQPNVGILFFSPDDSMDYVSKVLEMGASGYILKVTSNKIFLHAIRTIYQGKSKFVGGFADEPAFNDSYKVKIV